MSESESGLRIARKRIAREAQERSGKLDLRDLGLERLPEELSALTHLRALWLGGGPPREARDNEHIGPNTLAAGLSEIPCMSGWLNDTVMPWRGHIARRT
jgi:hypothetical protein